ncbi:hypothetical protein [Candidatus Poriferisodalis sp.]|uniref:hypothetical protein n=1 Tax=Candidatus Poriferisodalis sp. TaxID=3101277 RepID=UPI003B01E9C9
MSDVRAGAFRLWDGSRSAWQCDGPPAACWANRTRRATAAAWQQFAAFTEADRLLRGNLVPDTWLAATALTNGASIATAAGFSRFEGLEWFDPVS